MHTSNALFPKKNQVFFFFSANFHFLPQSLRSSRCVKMYSTQLCYLLLVLAVSTASGQNIGCDVAGECVMSNTVGIISTDSYNFCGESCKNTTGCSFFTLYAKDSVCVLSSDCNSFQTGTCLDCTSGEVGPYN